jgi:hypothetical protein
VLCHGVPCFFDESDPELIRITPTHYYPHIPARPPFKPGMDVTEMLDAKARGEPVPKLELFEPSKPTSRQEYLDNWVKEYEERYHVTKEEAQRRLSELLEPPSKAKTKKKTTDEPVSLGAEEIANKLGNYRNNGEWHNCNCPVCDDKHGHLGLKDGTEGLIVHCFHDCPPKEIYKALVKLGYLAPPKPTKTTASGKCLQPIPLEHIPQATTLDAFKVKAPKGISDREKDLLVHERGGRADVRDRPLRRSGLHVRARHQAGQNLPPPHAVANGGWRAEMVSQGCAKALASLELADFTR